MRPLNRLRPWQRWTADAVGLVLLASGALWLAVHYSVGAGAGELPHPLEPWSMRLHGLAAMAGLFVLGVVAAGHVPHGWRVTHTRRGHRHRRFGVVLCVLAGVLVASGYVLYYFVPEGWRAWAGGLHSVAGFAAAAVFVVHRRRR